MTQELNLYIMSDSVGELDCDLPKPLQPSFPNCSTLCPFSFYPHQRENL